MKQFLKSIAIATAAGSLLAGGAPNKQPSSANKIDTSEAVKMTVQSTSACAAESSWVTSPSLPTEVPNGGSNFCDFYQFSWQSFLYMMAPSTNNAAVRNFEDASQYPAMLIGDDHNSCAADAPQAPQVFVRVKKSDNPADPFVLPERIGQAGGNDTIYDQNGNVVFYSMYFSKNLCDKAASASPHAGNLPDNSIELKLAWKVLRESTVGYVTIQTDIDSVPGTETLGLIGFHLIQSTPEHPEMVWSSFEHNNNAPSCTNSTSAPSKGWNFTSAAGQACLETPASACAKSSDFNGASPQTALTGTASEICRLYPEGTASGDYKSTENYNLVTSLNSKIVGASGLVTKAGAADGLAILTNYQNIGALWVSDIAKPSGDPNGSTFPINQRGSLRLENSVMETTHQGTVALNFAGNIFKSQPNGLNCFTCHAYTPNKTAQPFTTSHIYSEIVKQVQAANSE